MPALVLNPAGVKGPSLGYTAYSLLLAINET